MEHTEQPPSLTLTPIGILRCQLATKVDAPRQPVASQDNTGVITLYPGSNFEHALEDIAGWERLWVIFWFHHNASWRPKVLPPRSASGRKGVFATRSPHRPNPLGLSALRLERVEGLRLYVRDVDLLDGTPILDIKPYVAYSDAFPDARGGWLAPVQDPVATYNVIFTPEADAQLKWIAERSDLALRARILNTLSLGPQPHPYRRIRSETDGTLILAVQDWRVQFSVAGNEVLVLRVTSGYRKSQLAADAADTSSVIALHRSFLARG